MTNLVPDYLLFAIGLVVLLASAEFLVRRAVELAGLLEKSRLFIGLTVTAFGTSAPELAVGISGLLSNSSDVGLGNVVGSNIFNIFFVLGLAALVRPIVVQQRNVRRDIPILLATFVLFFLMALDGSIGTVQALILVLLLVSYLYYASRLSPLPHDPTQVRSVEVKTGRPRRLLVNVSLIAVSIALMSLASHWMVEGVLGLAGRFAVSPFIIGLTVVAVGTSLPEIATTVAAVRSGQFDLAVGNVLGSCFFNIIAVPAAMVLIGGHPLPFSAEAIRVDLPFMILALVACLPVFLSDHRISRAEGALFLAYYAIYVLVLCFRGASDASPAQYRTELLLLALPIVIVTLITTVVHIVKRRRRSPRGVER